MALLAIDRKLARLFWLRIESRFWIGPGNSPDFNPIENLWTNIKNKVAEKHPSSAKDLVKVINPLMQNGNIFAQHKKQVIKTKPILAGMFHH